MHILRTLFTTLFVSMIMFGCSRFQDPKRVVKTTEMVGEVKEIRILASAIQHFPDPSGDALAGALVGGALAGKKGAIAGAILGSSSSRKDVTVTVELKNCIFFTELDGRLVRFENNDGFGQQYENRDSCALLKEGDKERFFRLDKTDGSFYYRWRHANDESYPTNGEVISDLKR